MRLSPRTFVGSACDYDFRLDVEIPGEEGIIESFEGLAQTEATSGVRVVVDCDSIECFLGSVSDPLGRGKVHVSLTQVYTISGKICNARDDITGLSLGISRQ